MDDPFICDADILHPCDTAAFDEAGLTLVILLALVFCISFAIKTLHDNLT